MTMTKTRWVLVGLLGLALATLALAFNNLAERIREIRPNLSAEELDLLVGLNGVFSRGSFQVTIRNGTTWRLSGLTVSLSWNAPQAVEKQSGLAAVGLRLQEGSTGMPGVVSVFVGEDLSFVPRGRIQYSWNIVGAVGIDPDTLDDTSKAAPSRAPTEYEKGLAAYKRRDFAEAVKWYRRAANQGNAKAQLRLAGLYGNGLGVPQDYVEAARWARRAAEQGDAGAQNYLGFMYKNGQGVPQDYAEAMKWYRKAAQQGNARAQDTLGGMYANGHGVPQDYAEAVRWFRKAAEQGDHTAQSNLGGMYDKGRGVAQDYAKAATWYRKAAVQGFARAQVILGYKYRIGQGVPQDYAEAVKWYRMAAEEGKATGGVEAAAQRELGFMYGKGQDYVQAYMWFSLAASRLPSGGREQVLKYRGKFATHMTPAQIAKAERLAREWTAKHKR